MTLPVCEVCGGPAIAVQPGSTPDAVDLFEASIPTNHGQPDHAWCRDHWPFLRRTAECR